MLYSRLFPKTLRQVPRDVNAPSHRLLLQAGFIRQVGHGLFSYGNLGMRTVQAIRRIIIEELENLGGQEVMTPLVNPVEIWRSSGRTDMVGKDMVRFADRTGRELVMAPTHEEAMVELVRLGLNSYRDLPLFLYQFQTKFRDEDKTRCGLVRTREFIMNDAYSFHRSFVDLNNFFPRVFAAYRRIFDRCGAPVVAAEAGVGYMGGDRSYEFMMQCDCGDDFVVQCDSCGYSANIDVARGVKELSPGTPEPLTTQNLGGFASMTMLRQIKKIARARMLKPMLYRSHRGLVMAVVRADHQVSEEKLSTAIGAPITGRASDLDLAECGLSGPFLSPLELPPDAVAAVYVVVDDAVADSSNLVAAVNQSRSYYTNVNFGRDFEAQLVADIVQIPAGSACSQCEHGTLQRRRAIELGNIFRLGDFYTKRMDLSVQDGSGRAVFPHMGSYGIGIGRLMAGVVEANHDERGIVWPAAVAPFAVYLLWIGKSLSVRRMAEQVYAHIREHTLFDDREESTGRKLHDADLLGFPLRVIVSRRTVQDGTVEVTYRRSEAKMQVTLGELSGIVRQTVDL